MAQPTIVWFANDLRLTDHAPLAEAVERAGPVIPLYIHDEPGGGDERRGEVGPATGAFAQRGGASRWWRHRSLAALDESLRSRGSRLIIRRGEAGQVIGELAAETGADALFTHRGYEPDRKRRDRKLTDTLNEQGVSVRWFDGGLLFTPGEVLTREGKPYSVFTPFWRACGQMPEPDRPRPAPDRIPSPGHWPKSLGVDELGLNPAIDWAGGLRERWEPGEAAGAARLEQFAREMVEDYDAQRNRPDVDGTSMLSPYLAHGELSPRRVWHAVLRHAPDDGRTRGNRSAWAFLRELGWREFAHNMLVHFPHTPTESWREKFRDFPWQANDEALRAWQRGRTGYPIVDAGMRQLWHIGWMHNRVRMIVASFLTKDLLIHWVEGARWFWDTLVDADLANNTLGWQWTAGCGPDAAPYFRVFNPVLQGEKFDPEGVYVRRWVPELANLPNRWLHKPWAAPAKVRAEADVELGATYPEPIFDHREARQRALDAYERIK